MAETKHTPTPWRYETRGAGDDCLIFDVKDDTVCLVIGEALAASIVQAVNSHDALLAACRKALTCASLNSDVADLCRNAIALAKGTT